MLRTLKNKLFTDRTGKHAVPEDRDNDSSSSTLIPIRAKFASRFTLSGRTVLGDTYVTPNLRSVSRPQRVSEFPSRQRLPPTSAAKNSC